MKKRKRSVVTVRNVHPIFSRNISNSSTVKRIIEVFESTRSVVYVKHATWEWPKVQGFRDFAKSSCTRTRHFNSHSSIYPHWRFASPAQKLQMTQQLPPIDQAQQREFINWIIEQQKVNSEFVDKIIFSGEPHFYVNSFVYEHKCRTWHFHPKYVTVKCELWSGRDDGPFFLSKQGK